jgi:hypothetical protein
MKKIVRLTESDLVRMVKRIVNEQAEVVNSMIINECGEKFGYPYEEGGETSNKFIAKLSDACYWFNPTLNDWDEEGIVMAFKYATPKNYRDGQKILQCAFKRGMRGTFSNSQEFSGNNSDPIMAILRKAFTTYGHTDIGDGNNKLKVQKELYRLGIKTKI